MVITHTRRSGPFRLVLGHRMYGWGHPTLKYAPRPRPGVGSFWVRCLTEGITFASGPGPAPPADGESSPVPALFCISSVESSRHLSLLTSYLPGSKLRATTKHEGISGRDTLFKRRTASDSTRKRFETDSGDPSGERSFEEPFP